MPAEFVVPNRNFPDRLPAPRRPTIRASGVTRPSEPAGGLRDR